MNNCDFKKLQVWQKAMSLTIDIYTIVKKFPAFENFGLASQMRRCSVSIPSNIAEGHGRKTTKDFVNFLYIAQGSLRELETQIEICKRVHYISEIEKEQLINNIYEIGKMLSALINSKRVRMLES